MKKPNPSQLNALLGIVSKKLGTTPEALQRDLQEGKFDAALNNMSPQDAEKFNAAVSNPKLVEQLMSAPQAQELYKKLTGEK